VAYTATVPGEVMPAEAARVVLVRRLDVARTLHSPLSVTAEPGDYPQLSLSSTTEGWLVAFTATRGGESRILGQHLPPSALLLTEDAPAALELAGPGSSQPALAAVDGRVLVAYRQTEGSETGAFQRRLEANGSSAAPAVRLGSDEIVSVRAIGSASTFYIAWSNDDGQIFGRTVATSSIGQTTMLNEGDPSPTGVFELGYSGATFSSVSAIDELGVRTARFRHITESGSILGEPKLLPYRQGEVADFSIARFSAGFAMAYRHAELGRNQLRLALIDTDGEELFNALLTSVSSGEGEVEIRQSVDGQLAVLWSDISLDGEHVLRIAGARCNP